CGYAREIDILLAEQTWSERFLNIQTINDKSAEEFVNWAKLWGKKSEIELATTPSLYNHIPKGLEKLIVLEKPAVTDDEHIFLLTVHTGTRSQFTSGDLLAI